MKLTRHAAIRQQQRGVPRMIVDLLVDWGTIENAGDGACKYYFDKASRKRLHSYAGPLARMLEEYLDYYAVISADGSVVTVAPRIKKIRH